MLGVVIDNTYYPSIDAVSLYEDCVAGGYDTDWWADKANTIELVGGLGPSEAYVLLPYSTIKLFNPETAWQTASDELGLDSGGVVKTSPNGTGSNFYDRVIRLTRMIKDNPDWDGETPSTQFIEKYQDLAGWIFAGSKAIDSSKNSTNVSTVHLAKFVDLRGLTKLVEGSRSANLNSVDNVNTSDTTLDVWGFYNDPAITDPELQKGSWKRTATDLWGMVVDQLPNDKFKTEPIQFTFPKFGVGPDAEPGNTRPHNLNFMDLTAYEAYWSYCRKISHEVFPYFDGTFQVAPIYIHTLEDVTWIATAGGMSYDPTTDTLRPLKLQLGERLYARVPYLVDQDHPPTVHLIPHSFMAVFSKTTTSKETFAVPPVCLWRGSGHTTEHGGLLPILSGSLFTQELIQDTDFFESRFITDHPFTMAGDPYNEHGIDRALRSQPNYLDCTFYAVYDDASGNSLQGQKLAVDLIDDGLRTETAANVYPAPQIANLIAKQHLRVMLAGDLGTVVLRGHHDFEPYTRYQIIKFSAGLSGPTTTLIGGYETPRIFPREVTTRNILSSRDFTGLAVVVATTPTDYMSEPTMSGATGDYSSFSQGSVVGNALPLKWDMSGNLVPDGTDTVTFRIVRGDTLLADGTIIFIKDKVAHAVSAGDYIRNFPDDTVDIDNDVVLLKHTDGKLFWGTAIDFQGPPGSSGGGGGTTYFAGYGMDLVTDTFHNNPTKWSNYLHGAATTFQFFQHLGTGANRIDPAWQNITNYVIGANNDQIIMRLADGSWKFISIANYIATPLVTAPQLIGNFNSGWTFLTLDNYNAALNQIIYHDTTDDWKMTDAWTAKATINSDTPHFIEDIFSNARAHGTFQTGEDINIYNEVSDAAGTTSTIRIFFDSSQVSGYGSIPDGEGWQLTLNKSGGTHTVSWSNTVGAVHDGYICLLDFDIAPVLNSTPHKFLEETDIMLTEGEVDAGYDVVFQDPPADDHDTNNVDNLNLWGFHTPAYDCKFYESDGVVHSGLGTAITSNTITLESGASTITDYYVGDVITADGHSGTVLHYNGLTRVITLTANWSVTPVDLHYNITSDADLRLAKVIIDDPGHTPHPIKLVRYATIKVSPLEGKSFVREEYKKPDYPDYPESEAFPPDGTGTYAVQPAGSLKKRYRVEAYYAAGRYWFAFQTCKALPPSPLVTP